MARKKSTQVPTDVSEQYYQIGSEVLGSFPKYRLPINLFVFKEEIGVLQPYSRPDQRLTNEQVEEVHTLCSEGMLFVSRSDFPVYSEHIIKQLDLILQDPHLTNAEVADLCIRSITTHFTTFGESPVKAAFNPLYEALMAFTEWIWQDKHRIKVFLRRLPREYTHANHAFISMIIGCWLWFESESENNITRRGFDKVALAFLLHDIGMVKIPFFILQRTTKLSGEDQAKVRAHPIMSFKIMQKLDLAFNELACCMMEHHERLDGSGYPQGSKGDQISKFGRMCAVVDAFSSMIAERPHSGIKEMEAAATELVRADAQFDKVYSSKILLAIKTDQFG